MSQKAKAPWRVPWVWWSAKKGLWRLVEPYKIKVRGHLLLIPAGFWFDLSSVPRLFWPIISTYQLGIVPPLVHDFMYRHMINAISRKEADMCFWVLMGKASIPAWRKWVAWLAVRAFGWIVWNKRRK